MEPSSTRTPLASVTVISLAPSNRSALALIVTAVGEMLRTEPAVGEVLTIDVSKAVDGVTRKQVSVRKTAINRFIASPFLSS